MDFSTMLKKNLYIYIFMYLSGYYLRGDFQK